MEKLLKLLNEWYLERYGTNPNFVRFEDYGGNDYGFFCSPDDERLMIESEVWTKKYGFIKRLVKNDKINFNKADADISKDIVLGREPDFADFMVYRRFLDEEKVLMLLAISDNPIDLLCKRLK